MKSKPVTADFDSILIQSLAVPALIGVYPEERLAKQTLTFDIEMNTCIQASAESDDVRHTVNYAEVSARVAAWVGCSEFELIESVAEMVASRLLAEFSIQSVRLTVYKCPGDMPSVGRVGVSIFRTR